jgi:hypothetical protein
MRKTRPPAAPNGRHRGGVEPPATLPAATAITGSAAALAALAEAIDFAGQALAPATRRAYRSDWQDFCAWCRAAG